MLSEEEIEKALDEIFKEDIETIRERMKSLMISYDNALNELVENDKKINELQKENTKLKEENQQIKDINVELNTDVSAWKTTTKELQKENEELKEENEKINKASDKMYEYISYYGWEDFESNTGCNREEMVDYFYKE